MARPEKKPTAEQLELVAAARAQYADKSNDDIEVDDPQTFAEAEKNLSRGCGGVWVRAWVWVETEDN